MRCWRATPAPALPPSRSRHGSWPDRASPRIDIADKVFGRPRFIHDRAFDGLLHGRVLRPAMPGAKLQSLDATAAERMPGVVAVVRDGSFVGVVAETEPAAVAMPSRDLRKAAQWSEGFELPDETRLADWLRSRPVETTTVDKREAAKPGAVARTMRHSYTRPFLAHASMAPSCAVARWGEPALEVWTHAQGIFNLRADLAVVLSRPPESIVVEHMEGAGCFGQNGADDAALDAVLLARAVPGRPVRLQWSREDEMSWAPLGAGMAIDIDADLDAAGEIVGWRHEVWSNGHVSRPGRAKTPTLLAASQLAQPFERLIATNPPYRDRRRGRAQLDAALRFPGLGDHQPPGAGDADPHLVAAHARRLRQRVRAGGRLGLLAILFEFIDEGRRVWVVGGGRNRYQFVYAEDLADACMKAMSYPGRGVFNVGSDGVAPLREVYQHVIDQAGTGARIASLPRLPTLAAMRLAHALGMSPLGPYQVPHDRRGLHIRYRQNQARAVLGADAHQRGDALESVEGYHRAHRREIHSRTDASAHRRPARMGVIRLLKWVS